MRDHLDINVRPLIELLIRPLFRPYRVYRTRNASYLAVGGSQSRCGPAIYHRKNIDRQVQPRYRSCIAGRYVSLSLVDCWELLDGGHDSPVSASYLRWPGLAEVEDVAWREPVTYSLPSPGWSTCLSTPYLSSAYIPTAVVVVTPLSM